jgi:hypothetical protein
MAELRQGKFGNYYGSLFTQSEPLTESEQKVNAKYIFSFLTDKGWSINSISALLGNMQAESSINPGRWQSDRVNKGPAYGLVQWDPFSKYTDWCTSENRSDPSEMDNNLDRIIYELNNKIQWYATPNYNFSFKTFSTSTKDVSYLAKSFVKNYERPADQSSSVLNYRGSLAVNWYNYLKNVEPSEPEPNKNGEIIESAVNWAVAIANDDSHGYDQGNRWGPDYDCSTLIISAYQQAGINVKAEGVNDNWTGTMEENFTAVGFESIPFTSGMELIRGDVLLRSGHTEMYIGDGNNVAARINENGTSTGGATGDQTGKEILVRPFAESGTWVTVLRLPQTGETPDIPDEPDEPETPSENTPNIHRSKLSKLLLYSAILND